VIEILLSPKCAENLRQAFIRVRPKVTAEWGLTGVTDNPYESFWEKDLKARSAVPRPRRRVCLAIVGKAANAPIFNGVVLDWQRIEAMFTIHNKMPTIRAPVRIGRPLVHFLGFGVELAGLQLCLARLRNQMERAAIPQVTMDLNNAE
jgi:hypothetical protein